MALELELQVELELVKGFVRLDLICQALSRQLELEQWHQVCVCPSAAPHVASLSAYDSLPSLSRLGSLEPSWRSEDHCHRALQEL